METVQRLRAEIEGLEKLPNRYKTTVVKERIEYLNRFINEHNKKRGG